MEWPALEGLQNGGAWSFALTSKEALDLLAQWRSAMFSLIEFDRSIIELGVQDG